MNADFVSLPVSEFERLAEKASRAGELSLALRRIASRETFTSALDLEQPTKVKTEAVIAELLARMRFALAVANGEAPDA